MSKEGLGESSSEGTGEGVKERANGSRSVSVLDLPTSQLTPGMRQYQDAKRSYPDCLIMLRMGDFYEMFYEDAITASRELEITLTARGQNEKRAPLAGIPFHALETYLGRLVKKGYKVAIIEQLEDPKQAKGLVKRGLLRIVTPGTIIEPNLLDEKENNYVMAVTSHQEEYIAAFCDISTGNFFTSSYSDLPLLISEITRLNPKECIIPQSLGVNKELCDALAQAGCYCTTREDYYFKVDKARGVLLDHFQLQNLENFGLEEQKKTVSVCGALISYLHDTQKNNLAHIKTIVTRNNFSTMVVDASTFRNLELVRNLRDGSSRGTLLGVLDKTVTVMGARLLRTWLKAPLLNIAAIEQRLDAVEQTAKDVISREKVREILERVVDIERIVSRVHYGTATPRDLLGLKQGLVQLPLLQAHLKKYSAPLLQEIASFDTLPMIATLLERSIRDDAPMLVREGGVIKPTFNPELEALLSIASHSKEYLQKLEEEEKKKTGINSLKIGYTRVFGYYIEITKKNVSAVPATYIRKQTTAAGERYITPELKAEEEKILTAEEKSVALELELYQNILRELVAVTVPLQDIAQKLAVLDVIMTLAKVSVEQHYCRPHFVLDEDILHIKAGRHPVVETTQRQFISNDIILNTGEMMIITGPNMAGKSTVMRQTALIVLMAQMGCFVPAQEVSMSIVDRVFTRVGAYDDVSSGQSTFMVEMNETAAILNNATAHSLVVLDEIGRGTSTFDGVSLAWSVAEHLYHKIRAKTLFATHYHVLNKMAENLPRIKNFNIAVREKQGDIIFLHKLVEGGTDQSYGIHVAKLAGLPAEVLQRARELQEALLKEDEMIHKLKGQKMNEQKGLGDFFSK
ncbi:DNA mismatch repair protein MutS [Candidatus Woesearchaeota archaeon]|nr:DNA mismatch repair protein MutS [Candidatus Woesearchaeota archaeon]